MLLPRVKPEHLPRQAHGPAVRIGGSAYGVAAEIADPTGLVWAALAAMDGATPHSQVVERLAEEFPDIQAEVVESVVDQLEVSGYVEDMAGDDTQQLSEREKERYSRGRQFFRWLDLSPRGSTWEPQLKLKAARVAVLGLGGSGGYAAAALAASGVGHLHLVDRDTVELSNLNRQILYTEPDIGRTKVDVAVERLRALNTDIVVTGERMNLVSWEQIRDLAADCDVLVLCADRPPEVRGWTNRACLATGTPWLDACYHGPVATAGFYTPGSGACWQCLRDSIDEQEAHTYLHAPDRPERLASVENAVAAPSAGIAGLLAAHITQGAITDVPHVQSGSIYTFNLMELGTRLVIRHARRSSCDACGGRTTQSLASEAS